MDDMMLLQECVVKVEEIKEEVCYPFKNGKSDMLEKSTDGVKAQGAVILHPKVEMEEETEKQEMETGYSTSASPVFEQTDSEEEELKPLTAVYLKTEVELEEETEEQDPLADPNACTETETRNHIAGVEGDDESSPKYDDGTRSSTHRHLQCEVCNEHWTSKTQLDLHMLTHTGDKLSAQKSSCMSHTDIPTGRKPFLCTICGNRFSRISERDSHVLLSHPGDKSIQCTVCHRYLAGKNALVQHLQIHKGKKLFQCSICQKRLTSEYKLASHMRIHTGEKPFQCTVCHKRFTTNSNINDHMRIHRGDKPFQCVICQKCFSTKRNRNQHIRIHTGEKTFQCTICNKCFVTKYHLNDHIRIHTGEKPFQCTICQTRFTTKRGLNVHIRSHT